MPDYCLTNAAVDDLKGILEHTLREWGEEQVVMYRDRLESRLKLLAEFPDSGRSNANLPDHILYVTEGRHYVFYRRVDDGIEVLRFLHVRMEIMRHISSQL